jgi:hypothetical protein
MPAFQRKIISPFSGYTMRQHIAVKHRYPPCNYSANHTASCLFNWPGNFIQKVDIDDAILFIASVMGVSSGK